ncbi:hypothetical protein HanXRQr2_Chr03g0101691 [Helianthus annuus]|uniref:Putative retrieval of early ER protein Rer1 n=1 Tax=Helianthus annuus TaxID=4232 RepID=A0A251V548_HELAN|nr:hypothetical protein HanXRQr2_Chr03g0101691 [Helianthus annuus]
MLNRTFVKFDQRIHISTTATPTTDVATSSGALHSTDTPAAAVQRWAFVISQRYQHLLEKSTPFLLYRWIVFCVNKEDMTSVDNARVGQAAVGQDTLGVNKEDMTSVDNARVVGLLGKNGARSEIDDSRLNTIATTSGSSPSLDTTRSCEHAGSMGWSSTSVSKVGTGALEVLSFP